MGIGNQIKSMNHLGMKAFGICMALLSGMILTQLPSMYKSEVDFHSKAIRATGKVVKTTVNMRTYTSGVSTSVTPEYLSTVKFQTNHAQSFEFATSKACSSLRDCENKEVPVLYDPSHPFNARVDSGSTPESKIKWGLMLSAFFLLSGIYFVVLEPTDGNQWNKNLR